MEEGWWIVLLVAGVIASEHLGPEFRDWRARRRAVRRGRTLTTKYGIPWR